MKITLLSIALFTFRFISAQEESPQILHVKFQDGINVSAESGHLFLSNEAYPNTSNLEQVGYWEPFYSIPTELVQSYYLKAKENLKKNLSDPRTIFEFHVTKGLNIETVKKQLEGLAFIKYVSIPPKLSLTSAPNLLASQIYLTTQEAGINAQEFWSFYNNHGAGVKVCDVEYVYNENHLDLPQVTIIGGTPDDPGYGTNHATAVLGEMGSLNNGVGTTGINYESSFYFSGAYQFQVYYLEEALINTLSDLDAGDVVLIEQQISAFDGTSDEGYVPVEWYEPFYDAIQLISGNGIIVVEAGANGSKNLDDSIFGIDNNGHYPFLSANKSEAIIVGAGSSGGPNGERDRLWFSNYGSRMDVQGIGENIVTTGYGDAFSTEGENNSYTNGFGGTSGASPMVTGAVALLQSLHRQHTGLSLGVNDIRQLLITTGKAQPVFSGIPLEKIGPLPNVFAAANAMMQQLGIDAIEKEAFIIYPNPSVGSFEIRVPSEFISHIQLRDLSGKEIRINQVKTEMGFELDNRNLEAGIYYLMLTYKDGTVVTKSVQVIG
jgi:subtilisin family serine protease